MDGSAASTGHAGVDLGSLPHVKTVACPDISSVDFSALIAAQEPVILKGGFADKPLVQAANRSAEAAMEYLSEFRGDRPLLAYIAPKTASGRFFYTPDLTGMNFRTEQMAIDDFFAVAGAETGEAYYVGSADLRAYLPGLYEANDLALPGAVFERHPPLVGLWMGGRTVAATHFDMSNNVATCMAGRRRFTLFPPDQIGNLYPGPLEPTPGGQVVSMVDFSAPDLTRYPNFSEALETAQVAELEPGDLLVYPALWWHNVEALDNFNVLVNYWWNESPAFMDSPMNTLMHGLLSLRDRPDTEKQAWRALFDHYVFGPSETAGAHLPEAARGPLGPLDDVTARRLRAMLLQRLNR